MNIEILTQPKLSNGEDFKLGNEIIKMLASKKPKYKTANFMFSLIKSNAVDVLKPYLKSFMDNGGIINFYTDSDKRFLSNPLVAELIAMGCNLYTYLNQNSTTEFQYRGVIFESAKTSEIFLTSGNFSQNGMFESHNVITHISYNLSEDKKEYTEFKNTVFNEDLTNDFTYITLENLPAIIGELKRATSIPTISDFTKSDLKITSSIDSADTNIAIEIDDSVDFVIPEATPVKLKNNEKESHFEEHIHQASSKENDTKLIVEYSSEPIYYGIDDAIDVENLLFETKSKSFIPTKPIKTNAFSSDTLFDEENDEDTLVEKEDTTITKVADLSKTSIFMFESPKITHKGVCAGEIKIPTYIRDLIADFWGWPKDYEIIGGQAKIKSKVCTFKIVDTKEPENHLEDDRTKLFQRVDESSFTIYSSVLEKLDISENDIIRLIKVSTENEAYYTCEIIRQDAKEYPIWEQFCTQNFKNSTRKYGIM